MRLSKKKKNSAIQICKLRWSHHLTNYFAVSLFRGMGFVKRVETKTVKQLPADFDPIEKIYVEMVSKEVTKFQIPDFLIIN